MAKYVGYKRPKNTKKAMKNLLRYLGYHKWLLLLVAVLVAISSGVSIAGTYLIRPVINDYAIPGDIPGLIRMMLAMGILYLCGVCATFAYNRLMVHTSQQVVTEIRRDLFAHIQKLPLAYFDAHTHGELMSRFTNDVDTVQEALNGTFSMLIQSFLILTGTLSMLFVLSARLTLIVLLFLAASGFFIWYNGKRSKKYFNAQQEALAAVNGFVEEMTAGQKVEKVFNHEKQDLEEFLVRNEKLRKASTNALTWSGMLVPVNVSMSYFNYGVSAAAGGIFALTGHMDLGTLASYLVYVRQSAMPLNQFTNQFNFLLAALSGAERIFDLMEQKPEIDEGTVTLCPVEVRMDGSLKETENYTGSFAWKDADSLTLLQGDVRFDQVVFGYTEEHKILDGISLFAKPGQKREQYDLCVSRAVANLASLSEYWLPYVKIGGEFISYKSGEIEGELSDAKGAVFLLGGKLEECSTFILPGTDIHRSLVKIVKVNGCPKKYPRKSGLPTKSPLH